MYEIRIHSRGGQGGVTAARLLALAAFRDGKYATACPFYGAERRGAPVVSFVRIDDAPIKVYSQIRNPDMVVVLDASVMDTVDVLQGLKPDGTVIINSEKPHAFPGFAAYNVDLTGIALAENLAIAGEAVGRLHAAGIVHGDLTTSNMIVRDGRCVLIDFGLAHMSAETEDRGVDLHVLFQTLESTTAEPEPLKAAFLQGYASAFPAAAEIREREQEIERRGRYL